MEAILNFDLVTFIKTVGYLGITMIVFLESGVPIGFFFPGDSLLFTAGFLSSQGYFSIFLLTPLAFFAAVLGDSFGYAFGRKIGPAIFNREDSFFFHKHHLEKTRVFYEKYGKLTIIIARFMPIVRTFAPILAGVGRMSYPTFISYNLIGGAAWSFGMSFLGYVFGNVIPNPDRYILPIVIAIIILSIMPTAIHLLKDYRANRIKK